MEGTIRVNNVLQPMMPYGCYNRVILPFVFNGDMTVSWNHRMSTKCRYDRKNQDKRCTGCKTEYDDEYVRALRK